MGRTLRLVEGATMASLVEAVLVHFGGLNGAGREAIRRPRVCLVTILSAAHRAVVVPLGVTAVLVA